MLAFLFMILLAIGIAISAKFTMESTNPTVGGFFYRLVLLAVWLVVMIGYGLYAVVTKLPVVEWEKEILADFKDLMLDIEARVEEGR